MWDSKIRMKSLGMILITIGLAGGVIAYLSGMLRQAPEFYTMGIGANVIQVIGLLMIFIDSIDRD